MNFVILSFSVFLLATATFAAPSGSNRHQVVRTQATTKTQWEHLAQLREARLDFDFWTEPKLNGFTDIMVSEEHVKQLTADLSKTGMGHQLILDDVELLVAKQHTERLTKTSTANLGELTWDTYYDGFQINAYLDKLGTDYPETVSILTIGQSTHGLPLRVVKISSAPTGSMDTPSIFITAGTHAREWISPASATYTIDQFVRNAFAYSDVLPNVDIYIMPVLNPDGYQQSFDSSIYRLWRKSRSDQDSPSGCLGVDINRNFDFKWGQAENGMGSSGSKCSDSYRGPAHFSEPEAVAVAEFIESGLKNRVLYVTIHSYGQYILFPWGYTDQECEHHAQMKTLADSAASAITSVYGTGYTTGSSSQTLYFTDGTDQDWAYGKGYFPYSYTMELRDTGKYGFLLPASQCQDTVKETFQAMLTFVSHVASG